MSKRNKQLIIVTILIWFAITTVIGTIIFIAEPYADITMIEAYKTTGIFSGVLAVVIWAIAGAASILNDIDK